MDDRLYLWPLGVVWCPSIAAESEEFEEESDPPGRDLFDDEDFYGLAA